MEQCEILKERGDNAYKALAMRAYKRGRVLYRMHPNNPEPGYIIAKNRVFLNRTMKALDTAYAPFSFVIRLAVT